MPSRSTSILILAIVVGFGVAARGDDKAVREELTRDYAKVSAAFKAKDMKTINDFMTPDFVLKQQNGTTKTRAEVNVDFMRQMMALESGDWKRSITKLTVTGDKATVLVDGNFDGVMKNPQKPDEKHRFTQDAKGRDTWVKTPAGWRIKGSEVLSMKMLMDGKPFNPMAPSTKPPAKPKT